MITNIGKNLLAKYLVGQIQSYASHIAVGCGPNPVASDGGNFGDYALKKSLDFEMFRVPIISRGFVNEDGIDKVVLTAQLPTEERYEITEVGIFSAASNPVAGSFDSRNIYSFAETDSWLYQPFNSPAIEIDSVYAPLDGQSENGIINQTLNVFQTNADNRVFTQQDRVARNERCRFLNNIIAIVGKNSPLDELRFAFSVVNKVANSNTVPDNVKILLEFSHTGLNSSQEYARFEVDIDHVGYTEGTALETINFASNRYVVATKALKDLNKTDNFDWREVAVAKIYACVTENNLPSDQFYVCLDGLRLENITSTNSLYGLTGYSVIKTVGAKPIIKSANTTNYIEFRFALGV
jgi:hypothetical protein